MLFKNVFMVAVSLSAASVSSIPVKAEEAPTIALLRERTPDVVQARNDAPAAKLQPERRYYLLSPAVTSDADEIPEPDMVYK